MNMKTNKIDVVKALGLVASVGGMAVTLISNWVSEQELNRKIDDRFNDKFDKAFAAKMAEMKGS